MKTKTKIPRRGEIWYIRSSEKDLQTGSEIWSDRPGAIVSNDLMNETAPIVQVVYLTGSRRCDSPLHVPVQSGRREATVLCEQTYGVDKSRLGSKIGELAPEELREVEAALCLYLDIEGRQDLYSLFKKWENQIKRLDGADDARDETIARLKAQCDAWRTLYETSAGALK